MQYLKKLSRWLHFSKLYGNYHFILIPIILLFLFINSFNYLIILLILGLFIYMFIKHRKLLYVSLFFFFLILSIYLLKSIIYDNAPKNINKYLIVNKIEEDEHSQKIVFTDGLYKYLYYNKNEKMGIGDIYKVNGSIIKYSGSNTPNGFDYRSYLKYQYIIGRIEVTNIIKVRNIFILNKINNMLDKYYENHFKNASIIKALVIGVKDGISDELSTNIQHIGISHLFVVSGLHVGIITGFLEKILGKSKLKNKYQNIIIYIFLGLYLIITNFLVSVLRVTLAYIIKNTLKKDFTSLDKMIINILIVLILNPFYAFNYSFILTYLISSMIIVINPILPKKKGFHIYLLNTIIISFISIIITLPIVVNISSRINILSILYNCFYIPFVSYVVLPISILVSILPFLEPFVTFVYSFFIGSIDALSNINFLSFTLPVLGSTGIVLYYLLFIFVIYMIEKKKWYFICLLVFFFCGWYFKASFDLTDKVVFLDISEGDATHIKGAFNKYNIIIDTGIETDDTIVTYLQKEGIRKIDLIIISHGDSDHNGNLERLIKNFNVKGVILSAYDYDTYEILKNNNFTKYKFVKRGSTFKYQNLFFEVIWPEYDTNDVNNNSLVFKMYYDNFCFLFTGDIEEKAENKIIQLEKKINVDVLKIAHHASNTSTKTKWLECVKFNQAVAMVGDKNTYGFPNKYTVNRLKEYTVYYTNEHDTIIFCKYFFKKKWDVFFHRQG